MGTGSLFRCEGLRQALRSTFKTNSTCSDESPREKVPVPHFRVRMSCVPASPHRKGYSFLFHYHLYQCHALARGKGFRPLFLIPQRCHPRVTDFRRMENTLIPAKQTVSESLMLSSQRSKLSQIRKHSHPSEADCLRITDALIPAKAGIQASVDIIISWTLLRLSMNTRFC